MWSFRSLGEHFPADAVCRKGFSGHKIVIPQSLLDAFEARHIVGEPEFFSGLSLSKRKIVKIAKSQTEPRRLR